MPLGISVASQERFRVIGSLLCMWKLLVRGYAAFAIRWTPVPVALARQRVTYARPGWHISLSPETRSLRRKHTAYPNRPELRWQITGLSPVLSSAKKADVLLPWPAL